MNNQTIESQKKFSDKTLILQIFLCLFFSIGFLLVGIMLFTLGGRIADAFDFHSSLVNVMIFLSTNFYLSWMVGVTTGMFDKLRVIDRCFLGTFFLNGSIIWLLKNEMDVLRYIYVFMIVLILNVLSAIIGSTQAKKYDDLVSQNRKTKIKARISLILLPFLFIVVFWYALYVILSFMN